MSNASTHPRTTNNLSTSNEQRYMNDYSGNFDRDETQSRDIANKQRINASTNNEQRHMNDPSENFGLDETQTRDIAYEKAFAFSVRIVKAYKYLVAKKKELVLSNQLLRSGTSIGANLAEARGAVSKADFSNKISLAYKECLEAKYWLALLKETAYISEKSFVSIYADADEIAKILFSILKKTRLRDR